MAPSKRTTCRFCAISAGEYRLSEADRPWHQDDQAIAFSSIGALVEGWTLVAPRDHSHNLLANYCDRTFLRFVDSVVDSVGAAYSSPSVFEHGSSRFGSETSCGTAHAHLHVVPLRFSLVSAGLAFDPAIDWTECMLSDVPRLAGKHEYLFAADRYCGGATRGIFRRLQVETSQFFRKVIAKSLNRPDEFDYRSHPQLLTARATSQAMHALARDEQVA